MRVNRIGSLVSPGLAGTKSASFFAWLAGRVAVQIRAVQILSGNRDGVTLDLQAIDLGPREADLFGPRIVAPRRTIEGERLGGQLCRLSAVGNAERCESAQCSRLNSIEPKVRNVNVDATM